VKKVRFYHTKGFRGLIAVALAVVLLGNGAIDRISHLFAADEGLLEVFDEATIAAPAQPAAEEGSGDREQEAEEPDEPEPQPTPEPEPEPTPEVLQPAPEQGLGDRDQGLGEKETTERQPPSEPLAQVDPQAEEVDEETDKEAEEEADEEIVAISNPLAEAIAADGMAYVGVNGDVFSSATLRERDRLGRVSGIAIATQYNEASENEPATVRVVFEHGGVLVEGYMNASNLLLLGYEATIMAISESAAFAYKSAAWPLAPVDFVPVKAAEPESHALEPALPVEPVITLSASIDGGKAVITALIEGIPQGVFYTLQWQNDLRGEFEDVPGETGESITFDITEENLRCRWRVALEIADVDD